MTRANDIATMIKDGRFIDYSRIPALLITEYPTIVAGSSTATLSNTYDITKLEVYLNGVLLKTTTEYTLSGTTLTLTGGEVFSSGDVLTVKVFRADANNVNLLLANAEDVNISNIADKNLLKFDSSTSTVIPTSLVEDGNGRIGINTTSPQAPLDVAGNIIISADTTESVSLTIGKGRSGNGYSYIDLVGDPVNSDFGFRLIRQNTGENAASILRHKGTGNFRFLGEDLSQMLFETDNTERMRITSDGNVGIGTTSPGSKLVVNGSFTQQFTDSDLLWTDINSGNNPHTPMSNELVIRNDAIDVTNSMASIFFRPGQTTSTLQINSARIAAIREAGFDTSLAFSTRATSVGHTEKMRITSGGNVGINTTSPGSELHVNGTSTLQGAVYLNRATQLENYDVSITGNTGATGSIIAGEGSGAVALSINDGYGNANLTFNHHAGTPDNPANSGVGNSFRIETNVDGASGGVMTFEGKSATSQNVAVALNFMAQMFADTGNMTIGGSLTQNSDLRIKKDLQIIPDALDKVKTLNGYTYTRTDRDSEFQQTGCVAQEVQAVLPEAVVVGEDEQQTLSIAYGSMVGLLVQAIKELEAKVAALESGGA